MIKQLLLALLELTSEEIILKKDPFQVDILYLSAAVEANLGNLNKADKILAKVLGANVDDTINKNET